MCIDNKNTKIYKNYKHLCLKNLITTNYIILHNIYTAPSNDILHLKLIMVKKRKILSERQMLYRNVLPLLLWLG